MSDETVTTVVGDVAPTPRPTPPQRPKMAAAVPYRAQGKTIIIDRRVAQRAVPILVKVLAVVAFVLSYYGTGSLLARITEKMGDAGAAGWVIGIAINAALSIGYFGTTGTPRYILVALDATLTWVAYWLPFLAFAQATTIVVAEMLASQVEWSSTATIIAGIGLAVLAYVVAWLPEHVFLSKGK